MDVFGLPVIVHGPGLPAPTGSHAPRNRGVEPLIQAAGAVRRPGEATEQVIQGELLQRGRGERHYSPTSDFLRSRLYEAGDAAGNGSGAAASSADRQAVGAYLSYTRDLIQPDANRGTAVDYFI